MKKVGDYLHYLGRHPDDDVDLVMAVLSVEEPPVSREGLSSLKLSLIGFFSLLVFVVCISVYFMIWPYEFTAQLAVQPSFCRAQDPLANLTALLNNSTAALQGLAWGNHGRSMLVDWSSINFAAPCSASAQLVATHRHYWTLIDSIVYSHEHRVSISWMDKTLTVKLVSSNPILTSLWLLSCRHSLLHLLM